MQTKSASSICPREWEGRMHIRQARKSEATFHTELELAIRESYFATNCPPLAQPSGCSHVGKNDNALAAVLTGVLVCVCVMAGALGKRQGLASNALINMLLCAEITRGPRIDLDSLSYQLCMRVNVVVQEFTISHHFSHIGAFAYHVSRLLMTTCILYNLCTILGKDTDHDGEETDNLGYSLKIKQVYRPFICI